mmetsp:Transcript_56597/g.93083  ORF Transcript_56597/g.93083 Transcript_56597/m.93083 type:complete len:290 (+) Transcript_56597:242-1111(+)
MSSFFCPTSALPACACCGNKLHGDVTTCTNCKHKVHALCTQGGHCFKCVCRVCNEPPSGDMRACKTCMHRVHTTCAVHVAYRVEVVCKTCTPRPEVASQPAKKKVRRYFNTKWQISRPWLQYANGVMSCLACKEYPQPGVQQTWLTGNAQQRELTVREHSNCGVHCKSLALWESGGASTTVIGGLPEPVRNAIAGLFQLVYRMAKRGSPPAHIPGDAEAVQLAGGTVTPSYQSHHSVATITHAIAAPIRSVEGEAIESSNFFALACDSRACIARRVQCGWLRVAPCFFI